MQPKVSDNKKGCLMSHKNKLKEKFRKQPYNKNLTEDDLDALMAQCDCEKKAVDVVPVCVMCTQKPNVF